jgi:hypothetical protein
MATDLRMIVNAMQRLASVPSKVWGITYLAMIPTFAVVFYLLPGRPFYHSTVQYESSLSDDAGPLLHGVREAIVANFRAVYHRDVVEVAGWKVDINDLAVTAIRPTVDEIEFRARIRFMKSYKEGPAVDIFPFAMAYSSSERNMALSSLGPDALATFYKNLSFKPEAITLVVDDHMKPVDFELLFPRPAGAVAYGPMLALSGPLNERIQDFWRATRGLPTGVSGGFGRMLYLSAMTITTVGYGDIVPITTAARLSVASEAVLGIVVIGLFLNSVAGSRSKER